MTTEATSRKRYHVVAWGSDTLPDINEDMDDVPDHIRWNYPVLQISPNHAIPYSLLKEALSRE